MTLLIVVEIEMINTMVEFKFEYLVQVIFFDEI